LFAVVVVTVVPHGRPALVVVVPKQGSELAVVAMAVVDSRSFMT
jgi:hypothetical protein